MQLPCFNEFKERFYLVNVKKVPYLPAAGSSVSMDDGSRQGCFCAKQEGLHLSVYAFSNEDVSSYYSVNYNWS